MKKRGILLFLAILLFIPISFSTELNCKYDPTPYIREKIPYIWDERNLIFWMCNITNAKDHSYNCMSYVHFGDNLIQSNPDSTFIEGIGVVDSFIPEPKNNSTQLINIHFTNKDLRDDRWVMFRVLCSDGNQTLIFEQNITPQYKDPYEIFDISEYGRDNSGTLLGFVFLLLFVIIIGGLIWKLVKG